MMPSISAVSQVDDALADPSVGHHDLDRGDPAAPVGTANESLGDRASERAGEGDPDLGLLVGREEVDAAVDRLSHVDGVEGREDEVTGLGGRESRLAVSMSRISPTKMTSGS